MGNLKILYKNWIDNGTLTFSSAVATLPGANIQDDLRDKVWRTTGCSEEWAKLVLSQPEYIDSLAIAGHNLSSTAVITVQGNVADEWISPAFEEEFDAWEPVIGYGEGWYGEGGYGGYIAADEQPRYQTIIRFLASTQYYRYWRIKITDISNPDGYIEIGRGFLGYAFQPQVNFTWDWEMIPVDPSVVTKSQGGQAFKDEKTPYTVIKFKLEELQDTEAFYKMMRLLQDYGTHQNCFVCLDPDSARGRMFTGFYGFFQDQKNPLKNSFINRWGASLTFEEAV